MINYFTLYFWKENYGRRKVKWHEKKKAKVTPQPLALKRRQRRPSHTQAEESKYRWRTVSFVRVWGQKGTRGKLSLHKVEKKVMCLTNFKRN